MIRKTATVVVTYNRKKLLQENIEALVLWKKSLRWMLLVFVLCWLDEASKIIIIGRHFSWIDTGKNVSGVFV